MIYYGAIDLNQIELVADRVVEALGGGDNAYMLIMETCQQETNGGTYLARRSAYAAGVGINQCDPIGFTDTRNRTSKRVKKIVLEEFGVNVDAVHHRELAYSPLLSFIWCRLHYLLRPGAIPDTIEGRAGYWKVWYNSVLGKGTTKEYIHNAQKVNTRPWPY